jgi:hypothetical protein
MILVSNYGWIEVSQVTKRCFSILYDDDLQTKIQTCYKQLERRGGTFKAFPNA